MARPAGFRYKSGYWGSYCRFPVVVDYYAVGMRKRKEASRDPDVNYTTLRSVYVMKMMEIRLTFTANSLLWQVRSQQRKFRRR